MKGSALLSILGGTVLGLAGSLYSAEGAVSQEGIDFIKQREGYSAFVYKDSAQKPTIGYGHLVRKGEIYDIIDNKTAEDLLKNDLASAEKTVRKYVVGNLTKNQFDALTSFVYNVGGQNFKESTLLKKLNAGEDVAQEFGRWVYAGGKKIKGLESRRAAEKELFLKK